MRRGSSWVVLDGGRGTKSNAEVKGCRSHCRNICKKLDSLAGLERKTRRWKAEGGRNRGCGNDRWPRIGAKTYSNVYYVRM